MSPPSVVHSMVLLTIAAAWDYSQNGEDWVTRDVGLCAGKGAFAAQSPIDLPATVRPTEARRIYLRYPPMTTAFKLYNNGNSIAFTLPEAYKGGFGFVRSPSELQGESAAVFRLWQVSFHAPSEHTLAGQRLPLEMQLAHQRVTGSNELAVVSVFFQAVPGSAGAPFLRALLSGGLPLSPWDEVEVSLAPASTSSSAVGGDPFGLSSVLAGSAYYAYEGSLTVPPCETGVKHFVRREVVYATPSQLRSFSKVLLGLCPPSGNYRNQPLHSTASHQLVLVGSVDTLGSSVVEAAAAAEVPLAVQGQSDTSGFEAMIENPDFQVLRNEDSKAMRHAKTRYQQTKLDRDVAQSMKVHADRALAEAQAIYESTVGAVSQMNQQSKVNQATDAVKTAAARLAQAEQALADAVNQVWKAHREALSGGTQPPTDGIAKIKVTTAAPTEPGSDGSQVLTTAVPFTENVPFQQAAAPIAPLEYPNEVVLPRGLAASPFTEHLAQSEAIVGGFGEASVGGAIRLTPNLRQPDVPMGSVVAPRVIAVDSAAPMVERPTPVTLRVLLPIPISSIDNVTAWAEQLQRAVAKDTGVPESQITVPTLLPATFSMQAPVPPAGAAFLGQHLRLYASKLGTRRKKVLRRPLIARAPEPRAGWRRH